MDKAKHDEADATLPMRQLLLSRLPKSPAAAAACQGGAAEELEGLAASQLRDRLLALAPLDKAWVVKVNQARGGTLLRLLISGFIVITIYGQELCRVGRPGNGPAAVGGSAGRPRDYSRSFQCFHRAPNNQS